MPPFKIAVLGGLVIDMVCLTDRIPDADDTITTDDYEELPSGKGGNSAVAAYRLSHSEPNGSETSAAPNCVPEDLSNRLLETPPDNLPEDDIQVHMVGAVGADGCGSILVSKLWENHVHTSGVRVIAGEKTGARLFVVETGSRNILKYFRPGANLCLLPTDFPTLENVAGGTKPDLVVSQLEIRQDTVRQILETANREGIETLLNPAPVQDLPTSIYKMITHLVVNKSEAAMLSGHKLDELTDEAGLASVTNKFLQMGVKNVVVTLGKEGAYYSNSPGNGGHVEAEKDVTVVDATGAGDTFVGAYAAEIAKQKGSGKFDMQRAVQFACIAAARNIERIGAQESIPWADAVQPLTE